MSNTDMIETVDKEMNDEERRTTLVIRECNVNIYHMRNTYLWLHSQFSHEILQLLLGTGPIVR